MTGAEQAPSRYTEWKFSTPSCSLPGFRDPYDQLELGRGYCDRRASAQAQSRATCCRLLRSRYHRFLEVITGRLTTSELANVKAVSTTIH